MPTSGIFCTRGQQGDGCQQAEIHQEENHGSLIPDLAPSQQGDDGKDDNGKYQNQLNENRESLQTIKKGCNDIIIQ